ncbi:hypothetical protein F9K91_18420 [Brucella tritici]|uniref:Uncharacterized protein n=1 Tax=Brucella tritici TaxID=94626 RepID=A0A7X6JDA6_9HYPH|nr:hypothetical protein [Brucella tritici]KAB2663393.1 hypothetical protein F9K91_18420 [Brucella tritici]NKW10350.1 hypothetical protein [Brucella tritici]
MSFNWALYWTSNNGASIGIALYNLTTGVKVASAISPIVAGGATFSDYITVIDTSAVSGSNTYELRREGGVGIATVTGFAGTIRSLVWKR